MDASALIMFLVVCGFILSGYPVAFALGGGALICAAVGTLLGLFDTAFLSALPNRLFQTITNPTLISVPLFVLMGIILEKSRIAEDLLTTMSRLFGSLRGGLGVSVILVGMLLAASTGVVGATVITMGLISLPAMLKKGYSPALAAGTICATGTLGQIIPPSLALVLLGDVLSNAYQKAQLDAGIFDPKSISVSDLFVGAIVPGLLLVVLYLIYFLMVSWLKPPQPNEAQDTLETTPLSWMQATRALVTPLLLILAVLGSIVLGLATPTEAAAVGAVGALILAALKAQLSWQLLAEIAQQTARITSMVFMILMGAAIFSLVFKGFGGEEWVHHFFDRLPGGAFGAMFLVMLVIFLLGFIIDFIEITFVVVPIVAPTLLAMGLDPIWLGIMIGVNLQTSFLTPPFGFSLFYLRGVAPKSVTTADIYRGVAPYILIQLLVLLCVAAFPILATGLPHLLYRQ